MTEFREAFPILHVEDVAVASAFYCSTLGFEEAYRNGDEHGVEFVFLALEPYGIGLARRPPGVERDFALWIYADDVDAVIGPDEPVVYPEHLTSELDYELELAVVLKKAGRWFSPEEAADYIGGYVIFNDITARDIQRGEMRSGVFSFCKAIDTFCPLGPWIVTPDEIPNPHDLAMELRVNGEVRQESHSSRMSVTIPEILSNFSALGYSAGDVLSTGTVSGVAGFKSPEERARLYLKPGDVIEAEIEGIGVLRNPVVSWQDAHGEPAPARIRPWGDA